MFKYKCWENGSNVWLRKTVKKGNRTYRFVRVIKELKITISGTIIARNVFHQLYEV